jgi:hypothetical protein
MDALIILLVGYVILKSIFSGGSDYDYDKKPERRRRKKSSFWDDTPTYSEYDTWNRSHGDKNRL